MAEYKGYKIVSFNKSNMKEVRAIGKGSVNKKLRGLYTTERDAERAIDAFKQLELTEDAKTD